MTLLVWIGLNAADAVLTGLSLPMGALELNPFLGTIALAMSLERIGRHLIAKGRPSHSASAQLGDGMDSSLQRPDHHLYPDLKPISAHTYLSLRATPCFTAAADRLDITHTYTYAVVACT